MDRILILKCPKPFKKLGTQFPVKVVNRSKGKLIIIDNADILLDDAMRSYIALDGNNQYIIIGRNPTGLLLNIDEVYELQNECVDGITLFTLKKSF